MGKSRNKVVLVALIVLIVILGVIFTCTYFFTELFMSEQELFTQYLTKNIEKIAQTANFKIINELVEKMEQSKYEENITMSYTEAKEKENLEQITIDIQNDPINKKTYGILSYMLKGLEEPLTVEYTNENDMYSLRFTNSVKQFFTVENSNLKQLATNLGMDKSLVDKIPNKIDFQQKLLKELEFNDKEKKTEINKYSNLLYNNIAKEKYTKTKDLVITLNGKKITTNAYILTLNNQDIKSIVKALLETLKNDEIIISKFQKLQSKIQLLDETLYVDSETLKEKYVESIQKIIDKLEKEEIIEENIVITIYEEKGNTVRIKLERGLNSITLDTTEIEGKKQIDMSFISIDEHNTQLSYKVTFIKENDNKLNVKFAKMDGEEQERSELIIKLLESENSSNLEITYVDEEQNVRLCTIDIKFVEEIDYKVVLNNSNNIVLNRLTSEKIINIFTLLEPRLATDYIEPYMKLRMEILKSDEQLNESGENFTVTIDNEGESSKGIVIYEELANKYFKTSLSSDYIAFFSNISESWLPQDINNEGEGSHNGEYYIAYTFYAENVGQNTINYSTTIKIDDIARNMDEAIRIMVFKNDSKVIYAKNNSLTGLPESNTVPFCDENTVMFELRENFKVGDIDKYTVVIWLDGNDVDALDDLIDGTIKMHMTLTEEDLIR